MSGRRPRRECQFESGLVLHIEQPRQLYQPAGLVSFESECGDREGFLPRSAFQSEKFAAGLALQYRQAASGCVAREGAKSRRRRPSCQDAWYRRCKRPRLVSPILGLTARRILVMGRTRTRGRMPHRPRISASATPGVACASSSPTSTSSDPSGVTVVSHATDFVRSDGSA